MPNTLSRVSAPHLSVRSRNRHRAGTRNRCPSTAQYIPLPIHCQYGGMPLIPVIRANLGAPVCTGTTGGGGAPVRRRAHPQSSFPQRRGGRRWVPVSTGTTGAPGRHPHRHSRGGGNPRRRAGGWVPDGGGSSPRPGDGFPSPRERRMGGGNPHRHSRDGASGDGFPSPRERRTHPGRRRESMAGGRGMGSRLHGNDGRTHIVIRPRQREGGDGFPSARERRRGGSQVISE